MDGLEMVILAINGGLVQRPGNCDRDCVDRDQQHAGQHEVARAVQHHRAQRGHETHRQKYGPRHRTKLPANTEVARRKGERRRNAHKQSDAKLQKEVWRPRTFGRANSHWAHQGVAYTQLVLSVANAAPTTTPRHEFATIPRSEERPTCRQHSRNRRVLEHAGSPLPAPSLSSPFARRRLRRTVPERGIPFPAGAPNHEMFPRQTSV